MASKLPFGSTLHCSDVDLGPTQGGESAAKVNMGDYFRQDEAFLHPPDTFSGPWAERVAHFPVSLPGREGLPSPGWVSATCP